MSVLDDDLVDALAEVCLGLGEVREVHHWRWRKVPFGPCPRCRWPANTLGPNGSPFHLFCWGNADPPSWWDQWVRRKVLAGEWGA